MRRQTLRPATQTLPLARWIGRVPLAALLLASAPLWVAGQVAGQTAPSTSEPRPQPAATEKPHNRLANESSPYLRLHAHNPVDWYPWGAEALAKAQQEGKVIFLSVGYSSCYWCHVMERESFMDDEIADFLNKHFVCIKVDREERPDVDSIYMTAVQMITRRGGWPMSVFLTPDAQPFFGGTYFPARDGDRQSAPGFLTVIQRVQQLWSQDSPAVKESAERLTSLLRDQLRGRFENAAPEPPDATALDAVQAALARAYDEQYGGFGFDPGDPQRPKFPEPSNLYFLWDRARRHEDAQARSMLVDTLERMRMGGIWDQLGGGFHRYSTDRFWQIPHFEKMLYDNGQLASIYSEAYRLTGSEDFRQVAEETLEFVLREMQSPEGAFYSAIDAESEHIEGKYYRWERTEVEGLLGPSYPLFATVYGLDGDPNFDHNFYVPLLSQPLSKIAADRGTTTAELAAQLAPSRAKLLQLRGHRPRPLTDTKILVSSNGLMIRGFADAGRVLGNPKYVQAAAKAADFLLAKLRRPDGRLLHTYTAGEAKLNAYLDDYAFLVSGLIALHRATNDPKWIEAAEELSRLQMQLYGDVEDGGFFFTSSDHEALIARDKQITDGAQPSGNSVSAENLIYLARTLNKPEYLEAARKTIDSAAAVWRQAPQAAPWMAVALARLLDVPETAGAEK